MIRAEGTPFEVGRGYGEQARDLIQRAAYDVFPRFLQRHNARSVDSLRASARDYEPWIERFAPELLQELKGLSEGAQISWEDTLLLQTRPELAGATRRAVQSQECTSIAVTGSRSVDGHAIAGQNVDMDGVLGELGIILHVEPDSGPSVLTWTLAGVLGQTGLNSAGVARCGNVLFAEGWRVSVPTSILFRLALNQPSIEDVVNLVRDVPRAKSNNFVLADSNDRIMDLELTVTDHEEFSSDELVVHTNHYCHPNLLSCDNSKNTDNSRTRLARITELAAATPTIGADDLKRFLSDNENAPDSICDHGASGITTLASCIMEPAAGRMHVSNGAPCINGYETFEVAHVA